MEYVYHFKSSNWKGNTIFTLSNLKKHLPDIYRKETGKYGRERLSELDEEIQCLGVTWKDVVNLSTINPIKILAVMELMGLKTDPANIFQIPIANLQGLKFCLFTDFGNQEKFKMLITQEYKEGKEIPSETIEHFIDAKKKHESPLVFEHVPHILVADNVDISNATIIKWH